jgi:hypothetical protein
MHLYQILLYSVSSRNKLHFLTLSNDHLLFGFSATNFFIVSVVVTRTLLSRYSPIVNIVNTEEDASKNLKSAPANIQVLQ